MSEKQRKASDDLALGHYSNHAYQLIFRIQWRNKARMNESRLQSRRFIHVGSANGNRDKLVTEFTCYKPATATPEKT